MTESRREKLLGYLLDALEDDEREAIDCEVAASPALHNELTELVGELQPLSVLKGYCTPADSELVTRTCDAIWQEVDAVAEVIVEEISPVEESVTEAIPEPVAETVTSFRHSRVLNGNPEGEHSQRNCTHCTESTSTPLPLSRLLEPLSLAPRRVRGGDEIPEAIPEPVAEAIPEPVAEEIPEPESPSPSPLASHSLTLPAPIGHSLTLRAQIQPRSARPSPLVPPHIRWASSIASITVGTLIAILFFPVFTFVKDKVVARVCQVLMLDVEANMEYYKQIQENSAIVKARESSGSLRTGHSQWRSLAPLAPSIAQTDAPTPEILDEIPPLKIALAQDSVASLFAAEQNDNDDNTPLAKNDNLRILADPKTSSGQGQRLYPFLGESIFISGDQVYYRLIPTR